MTLEVVLVGPTGAVGGAVLRRLAAARALGRGTGVDLRLVGAFNRTRMAWDARGLDLDAPERALATPEPVDRAAIDERLGRLPPRGGLVVDCTASPEVAARYPALLWRGVGVVTPNKLAVSGPLAVYRTLESMSRIAAAPYHYETTVGAGLPILRTLRELRRAGDRLRRVRAVLSGSLSFVFREVGDGRPFSAAVAGARARGLTEPHPGHDLSGEDVARKLVIALREAGLDVEKDDVEVERLLPASLEGVAEPDDFVRRLRPLDAAWEARSARARRAGRRLAHVAEFDGVRARVGLDEVDAASPFARLEGAENRVVIETDRYAEVPLSIAGPGAGPDVTAGGIVRDILAAAGGGADRRSIGIDDRSRRR